MEKYCIGLMSGTSLDGVDAALVRFTPEASSLVATAYQPFPADLQRTLLGLHTPQADELDTASRTANTLAATYAKVVTAVLDKTGVPASRILAIGQHGQTIRHRPERGYTIQLGNAALLAELTGIDVVADFRSRDIAAGGQGAPLVPAFHAGIFAHPLRHRVIVNIGGISNLTSLAPTGLVHGFDCGPGNMLLDRWIGLHRGEGFDADGAWARTGILLPALLARFLETPFFREAPPKSTGRDLFDLQWLTSHLDGTERPEDVQATLVELSAGAIAGAIHSHCPGAEEIYLCGGGAYNGFLRERLAALAGLPVDTTAALGVVPEAVEAFAFAWLAHQTVERRPGNLPAVTGARAPRILGAIYPA